MYKRQIIFAATFHLCTVYFILYFIQYCSRSLYFGPEIICIPHPCPKMIFSPSCDTLVFDSYCALFAVIFPYLAFTSHFSSPFLLFLSRFFLFLYFLPFSLLFFKFFPQLTLADIPPWVRDIFQYIEPCTYCY